MAYKITSNMDEFIERIKKDPFSDIQELPCPEGDGVAKKNDEGNFVCEVCGSIQIPNKKNDDA